MTTKQRVIEHKTLRYPAMKIRESMFSEILELLPKEETPEAAELHDMLDKLGLTYDQRWDFDNAIGAVILAEIERAFMLGWQLRDNPNALIFE